MRCGRRDDDGECAPHDDGHGARDDDHGDVHFHDGRDGVPAPHIPWPVPEFLSLLRSQTCHP